MNQTARASFCELKNVGLIAFSGEDAAAFLHAQLTSDVAGMVTPQTQYSGYCSPKGRLLATFLLWRRESDLLLQVATGLHEILQERLSKYVLRSRVRATAASERYALFGLLGPAAPSLLSAVSLPVPGGDHEVMCVAGVYVTRLPLGRYVLLTNADRAPDVRVHLQKHALSKDDSVWEAADIEAGIPVIQRQTLDQYIPQMVNLDLIGGVSYSKGCYPGQEIVARTHYLGRLKQRMYRVRIPTREAVRAGDPLFSAQFGDEQASGSIVQATATESGACEALAVIQKAAHTGPIHFKSPQGAIVERLPLPYPVLN